MEWNTFYWDFQHYYIQNNVSTLTQECWLLWCLGVRGDGQLLDIGTRWNISLTSSLAGNLTAVFGLCCTLFVFGLVSVFVSRFVSVFVSVLLSSSLAGNITAVCSFYYSNTQPKYIVLLGGQHIAPLARSVDLYVSQLCKNIFLNCVKKYFPLWIW